MLTFVAAILALFHPHAPAPTTTAPRPVPTTTAPKATVAPAQALSAAWECIVRRESGGNPRAINPSSGASGVVQFLDTTWHAMGMTGKASDWPADVQMATAYRLQAMAGWAPWRGDGCVG